MTLVELLAVIVILAIVAAIAFVMIGQVIENSKKQAHVSNALNIISAARLYEADVEEIPSSGVSAGTLEDEQLLNLSLNPWTKKRYNNINGPSASNGIVTKVASGYHIKLKAVQNSDVKCDIDTSRAELIEKGDKLCP